MREKHNIRIKKPARTFWFDMDGVMAIYNREAYKGDDPIFSKLGYHYFRTVQPDMTIVRLIQCLSQRGDCTVYVLTKVSPAYDIMIEQLKDKAEWLARYFPFIGESHFYYTTGDKGILANNVLLKYSNRTICKSDILIDDFNQNLESWIKSGGSSVKYLNGLNSSDSFDGLKLLKGMGTEDAIKILFRSQN